eukprot:TRINITY_DN16872_c0_g1_i1.p3 TRINITY_DN16872_c0_g1~~TRINITY_DN16872_c0_g1_i1.p3  ORF type:complete len:106 (+),score=0.79 TRINITY_DN16872_c0_g1_i1:444-761(+)
MQFGFGQPCLGRDIAEGALGPESTGGISLLAACRLGELLSKIPVGFLRVGCPRLHGSQATLRYQAGIGRLKCLTMPPGLGVTTLNQLEIGKGQTSLDTLLIVRRA